MAKKAILYDATRCIACRACQVACKQQNELQAEGTSCWGTYENPPYLSAKTWLRIKFQEVGDHEKLRWLFLRESCMHCEDASCVNVCPEGALYHHGLGFVALNREKCTGCETCVRACPFGIPRMERESWDGRFAMKATKCTFCQECIEKGTSPACVEACPTGALKYDDRDDLVAEGRRRVDNLKMEYPNACLYGEKECGGLHVVYVLEDFPEAYGLPVKPMMWSIAAFLAILTGLGWIISRRKERMKR